MQFDRVLSQPLSRCDHRRARYLCQAQESSVFFLPLESVHNFFSTRRPLDISATQSTVLKPEVITLDLSLNSQTYVTEEQTGEPNDRPFRAFLLATWRELLRAGRLSGRRPTSRSPARHNERERGAITARAARRQQALVRVKREARARCSTVRVVFLSLPLLHRSRSR